MPRFRIIFHKIAREEQGTGCSGTRGAMAVEAMYQMYQAICRVGTSDYGEDLEDKAHDFTI